MNDTTSRANRTGVQAGFAGACAAVIVIFFPQITTEQALVIAAVLAYALSWLQNYGEWRGWWPAVGRNAGEASSRG